MQISNVFRPRVIPCLLLQNQGLVKTIQFKEPRYIGDPINAVRIFNSSKSDELVFLDITNARERSKPKTDILKDISDEAFMPFAAGGGVQTLEDVRNIIDSGAEKVVINTAAFTNPALISEASAIFGSQAIIGSIDVRKNDHGNYDLFSNGGTVKQEIKLIEHVRRLEEFGVGEILINSIDNDGMMSGFDHDLIRIVSSNTTVPVIACGGASDIDEIPEVILEDGASAVAAGSIFVFIGSKRAVLINYPDQDELFELFEEN